MAYTTIDDPTIYFNIVLYTGNGYPTSGTQSITGVGFKPDWLWVKCRDAAQNNNLSDVIRGASFRLKSNATSQESELTDSIVSHTSDGFNVGTGSDVNLNSNKYVAWNWKAGTSFTNDASSTSIGTIDSTGSVSTAAGFSIVSYTGTGSNGTIAHGLGSKPNIIINKTRDTTNQMWSFYHSSLGATKHLGLDRANAVDTGAAYYQDTEPTSTVFSVGSESATNHNGAAIISYCFAEKQGYSKFGSYTGNGNANGPFVYLGFKPAFVMVKNTGAEENWIIFDNKRPGINLTDALLKPSLSNAESTSGVKFDMLSNGFKARVSDAEGNSSGGNFIYMAFAEQPFVTSTGVPATAR